MVGLNNTSFYYQILLIDLLKVIQFKLAVEAKGKLKHNENGLKVRCNANKDMVQLTVNQRPRKREIAATIVFVCTGHRNR